MQNDGNTINRATQFLRVIQQEILNPLLLIALVCSAIILIRLIFSAVITLLRWIIEF
jgi:hypothetical protein